MLTAGLEFEMVKAKQNLYDTVNENTFGVRRDRSIQDAVGEEVEGREFQAIELVTPVYEVGITWSRSEVFPKTREALSRNIFNLTSTAESVNSSCGIHLHIGNPSETHRTMWNPNQLAGVQGGPASEWSVTQVYTWLMVGVYFEQAGIFDTVPKSRAKDSNCAKIISRYQADELSSNDPIGDLVPRKYDNIKRYCWLNLIETRRPKNPRENRIGYASSEKLGTVEIRLLGETMNPEYIVAWCDFWLHVAAIIATYAPHKAIMLVMSDPDLAAKFSNLKLRAAEHEIHVAPQVRSVVTPRHAVNAD